MRKMTCNVKNCPSCRGGLCHDTSMVRIANFKSRKNEGVCFNWKPSNDWVKDVDGEVLL